MTHRARRLLPPRPRPPSAERALPVAVAAIVVLAGVLSLGGPRSTAGHVAPSVPPRIVVVPEDADPLPIGRVGAFTGTDATDDGTLWKPVAVDTTVLDGRSVFRTYVVQAGDTFSSIAARLGVSAMTIRWANGLMTLAPPAVGSVLVIPPVTGLVITVAPGDTLAGLSERYGVDGGTILLANGISDPTLIVGQELVIPGAAGPALPTPAPVATPAPVHWLWPVAGPFSISRGFSATHDGIDIAAAQGTPIVAPASGRVAFAGYRDGGGAYQVWIDHGGGIYSVHLHMSAIEVGVGQVVVRGQEIGRVGMTGNATGPHDHFGVWVGTPWGRGAYAIDPARYY